MPIKSNTAKQFYWKSRSRRKYNNFFHYRKSEGNCFGFFPRNCESIVNLFGLNILSV